MTTNGEIQDEDKRELAREALSKLWDAMELTSRMGIRIPGDPDAGVNAIYGQAYYFLGRMLLGEECPEKEVYL